MTADVTNPTRKTTYSPVRAWARALELTSSIARRPDRVLPTVIDEQAAQLGDSPALLSDRESLTYAALSERSNRYARWGLDQGLVKGEAVGLLMPNRPEYLATWLGITKIGGVVALLNTSQTGPSLAHSINLVAPKHLIVEADLLDRVATALPDLFSAPMVWSHGAANPSLQRIDTKVEEYAGETLSPAEKREVTIEDQALYIYTSGTTGLPKAAKLSHGRVMQSSYWFYGMMGSGPADRVYNCLPMYHTVGGVQVPGAILASGGSVVIREKFSARSFWSDVKRWDCTLIQYIGELCRYLLHAEAAPNETGHRVRMACGNGLSPDVWVPFQNRFRIPRILEFYGSTEGNVTLFNVEGEPGAVGRIPSYLAHRFPAALVKFDFDQNEPMRNEQGFCIPCGPNEVGEAIGEILKDSSKIGSRFEGYTSSEASEKKMIRGAFRPGDAWFRTGDLMRKDTRGFFYFVDRIGDTFRWKGENVSTLEVSKALSAFPGVREANVYGVAVPGADGRAGMATLVMDGALDFAALRIHLAAYLPEYAHPLFLRISSEIALTATFKHTKAELSRRGYDPAASADPIYFNDSERGAFVRLDEALYKRIQAGQISYRRGPLNLEIIPVPNAHGLATGNAAEVDRV